MKRRKIDVKTQYSSGMPSAFYWRGRWRRIDRLLDAWRETGRWWMGEAECDLLRVEAGGVFLLSRQAGGAQWYLEGEED